MVKRFLNALDFIKQAIMQMFLIKNGFSPKFRKYVVGFSKVYKDFFGTQPTMGELVFNGWLEIKDKKVTDFKKMGETHARILVCATEEQWGKIQMREKKPFGKRQENKRPLLDNKTLKETFGVANEGHESEKIAEFLRKTTGKDIQTTE